MERNKDFLIIVRLDTIRIGVRNERNCKNNNHDIHIEDILQRLLND